jgi:hypothetical protein
MGVAAGLRGRMVVLGLRVRGVRGVRGAGGVGDVGRGLGDDCFGVAATGGTAGFGEGVVWLRRGHFDCIN